MSDAFHVPVGLSDHSLEIAVPITAVALGACIIEKHFTLSRSNPSPDSAFSLEPHEFEKMVQAVRSTEKALGKISYSITNKEQESRIFRRSLFAVQDIKKNEEFTMDNVQSIRPGHGLHTRNLDEILGRKAVCHLSKGTPLSWSLIR